MTTFRDYVYSISPPWLQRYYGERFMGGMVGLFADLMAEGMSQACLAHLLRSSTSPRDALRHLGYERMLPRYAADTDASYRNRLWQAWTTYDHVGNNTAIIEQYNAYGLSNVTIETVLHDAYPFEAPLDTAQWSRFAVIIGLPHGISQWTYGSGILYGQQYVYGAFLTVTEVANLFDIADKFKSGHEVCPIIKILWNGTSNKLHHP
jgi:hypothetical protein